MSAENEPRGIDPEIRQMLRERYGIREKKSSWRILATLFALIGIPWLIWSGWHHSNPEIRADLVSFAIADKKSIDITFDVTRREPSTPLLCTLVARDFDKNVAGELDLQVPPSDRRTIRIKATIPTRVAPVNAAVLRCSINRE